MATGLQTFSQLSAGIIDADTAWARGYAAMEHNRVDDTFWSAVFARALKERPSLNAPLYDVFSIARNKGVQKAFEKMTTYLKDCSAENRMIALQVWAVQTPTAGCTCEDLIQSTPLAWALPVVKSLFIGRDTSKNAMASSLHVLFACYSMNSKKNQSFQSLPLDPLIFEGLAI